MIGLLAARNVEQLLAFHYFLLPAPPLAVGLPEARGPQKSRKNKILRMGLPIVEHLGGLQESILSLFGSPNSIPIAKRTIGFYEIILFLLPLFPRVGPMAVWSPLLLLYLEMEKCRLEDGGSKRKDWAS